MPKISPTVGIGGQGPSLSVGDNESIKLDYRTDTPLKDGRLAVMWRLVITTRLEVKLTAVQRVCEEAGGDCDSNPVSQSDSRLC